MNWGPRYRLELPPIVAEEFDGLAAAVRAFLSVSLRDDGSLIVGEWADYPVRWTAAGATQPVLGNGFLRGRYAVVGSVVHYSVQLIAGSTTTFGDGTWSFSLPIVGTPVTLDPNVATVWAQTAGSVWHQGAARIVGHRGAVIYSADGQWNASTPVTWAAGDTLNFSGVFEAGGRGLFVAAAATPPPPPPVLDYSFTYAGAAGSGAWDLSTDGPFLLSAPGTTTLVFAGSGFNVVARGVAAGGTGGEGFSFINPPFGVFYVSGGGGGSGARHAGLTVPISSSSFTAHVGASGGDRDTRFGITSGTTYLELGGGGDGEPANPGVGGEPFVGSDGLYGDSGSPGGADTTPPVAGGAGGATFAVGVVTRGAGGTGGHADDTPSNPGSEGEAGALLISLAT
jgi:hypothetical protein